MSLVKGQHIGGIRTVEDVRQRCYVDAEGCWRWRGACKEHGTPQATVLGRRVSVRRWVLEQTKPMQTGRVFVVARCGNHDCVAPRCVVSKRGDQYMRWLVEQGRLGTPKHRLAITKASRKKAKLSPTKAAEIARRIHAGEDRGEVAAAYGISRGHANKVARAENWAEFVHAARARLLHPNPRPLG
jgi:hypothetical protein